MKDLLRSERWLPYQAQSREGEAACYRPTSKLGLYGDTRADYCL